MAILSKKLTQFDKEDVQSMNEMLEKFAQFQGEVFKGKNYSPENIAYIPVLALALLKSQRAVQTLTWALVGLTAVLAVLTGFIVAGI